MSEPTVKKKILFAVGGTGGHLFAAQALARELQEAGTCQVLFGGGNLSTNRYFHKDLFPYHDITSSTPFRHNWLSSIWQLGKGVRQSLSLVKEFVPDLIVGFGSFHSFPLLAAAQLKHIPYVLVEQNAMPGRVNRLFASRALFSAVQFQAAERFLKGKTVPAKIPLWAKKRIPRAEARRFFHLDPNLFTLLVFGGSQGAKPINIAASRLSLNIPFQVIHLCGDAAEEMKLKNHYRERGVLACVKPFEEKMENAWSAADVAICRSGAATLAELLFFGVPAVLVPWPGATDDHQTTNAKGLSSLGGALLLEEKDIVLLSETVAGLMAKKPEMERILNDLQRSDVTMSLRELILKHL